MPLTRLTAFGFSVGAYAWSPDGTKVAFDSPQALDGSNAFQNAHNIWTVHVDGTGTMPLTKLTADRADSYGPMWSLDGKRIVFYSNRALDGTDAANWSPNAYDPTSNIWVVDADGSSALHVTGLTAAQASSQYPAWSPDGSKIAFSSYRALDGSDAAENYYTENIWIVNAGASGAKPLTRLTSASVYADSATWSPNGTSIEFNSQRALDGSDARNTNDTFNLWVMNVDGTGAMPLTRLTGNASASWPAVWSGDSTKLAFSSDRMLDGSDTEQANGVRNIWLINADGRNPHPVTRITTTSCNYPQWTQ
jgi:Tol biopolymer transport system component